MATTHQKNLLCYKVNDHVATALSDIKMKTQLARMKREHASMNKAFNLTIKEYNDFEAGEGKSQLDSHFAHISHKIVQWVCLGGKKVQVKNKFQS